MSGIWRETMKTGKLRKGLCKGVLFILLLLLGLWGASPVAAATKAVKLGETISVAKKGAKYKSSDTSIAYVSDKGVVTGKNIGQVTITVKNGETVTKHTVSVEASGKKKKMTVCADEIQVQEIKKIDYTPVYGEGAPEGAQPISYNFKAAVTLKNVSSAAAKKVELRGKIGKEIVAFNFGKIKAGISKTATVKGEIKKADQELVLRALDVYSGEMLARHNMVKDTYSLLYGTEDKTKPVISGFIGENSYNTDSQGRKMPYRIVYSNEKDKFDFFKYVSATDDREGKVELTVDTSKVNFKKTGNYRITYKAKDKAGNVAKEKAYIGVRVPNTLDKMSADVLDSIIKPSWSDKQKAVAIYNFTRRHMSYSGTSDKTNWEKEARRGLNYGTGDCFTYYATARALLTRAGIPNIEVNRVRGVGRHWWNMAYVAGGFYHYDVCPRGRGGKFCLVTDDQLKSYSRTHGNSHIWAYDKKPKSATKKLSSIF
ncbi:MAG TPA: hypothetical protein DF613_17185 [Lachnospiraceae bacterium]|nr:hypothetical protein [Lachnospiraceae bacterium]